MVIRVERLGDKNYQAELRQAHKENKSFLSDTIKQMRGLDKAVLAINCDVKNLSQSQKKYLMEMAAKYANGESIRDYAHAQQMLKDAHEDEELFMLFREYKKAVDELSKNYIALSRECLIEENVEKIKDIVLKSDLPVVVAIDREDLSKPNKGPVDYVYNERETRLLMDLNQFLLEHSKQGLLLSDFSKITIPRDFNYLWKMEEVVEANNKIDEVVAVIEENNFSPFEAMLYIHKVASSFIYNKDEESKFVEESRVLPSILNYDTIVCSGYASFVKAVVDRVGNDLLKGKLRCDFVGCTIADKEKNGNIDAQKTSNHSHNLVYIDDPKYKIKGYYVEDACWDAPTSRGKKANGFAHCLYPVVDLINFEHKIYMHHYTKDRKSNILCAKNKEFQIAFIEKIYKQIELIRMPEIVLKNVLLSKPISMEKYEQGLKTVVSKTIKNKEKVLDVVEKELNKSIKCAKYVFLDDSVNCFSRHLRKAKKQK